MAGIEGMTVDPEIEEEVGEEEAEVIEEEEEAGPGAGDDEIS